MRCAKCDAQLKNISVKLFGENYRASECPSCNSRTINLDIAMKLHEKFAPRVEYEKRIIKIGESSAITIPKEVRHFFLPGSPVSLLFDPQEMMITIRKK
jgi:DNA-directed RNA polymerase subunit RPC12/RpoP